MSIEVWRGIEIVSYGLVDASSDSAKYVDMHVHNKRKTIR